MASDEPSGLETIGLATLWIVGFCVVVAVVVFLWAFAVPVAIAGAGLYFYQNYMSTSDPERKSR